MLVGQKLYFSEDFLKVQKKAVIGLLSIPSNTFWIIIILYFSCDSKNILEILKASENIQFFGLLVNFSENYDFWPILWLVFYIL